MAIWYGAMGIIIYFFDSIAFLKVFFSCFSMCEVASMMYDGDILDNGE